MRQVGIALGSYAEAASAMVANRAGDLAKVEGGLVHFTLFNHYLLIRFAPGTGASGKPLSASLVI
jgi:hypothetical protein